MTTTPPTTYARTAGFFYLLIILCGIFSEVVVRSSLIVPSDATTTANNIIASASLFRLGFAADTIMLFSDVIVMVLFYVLFRPVDRTLSLLAAAFRLMMAAILGFNLLNHYAPLLILNGSDYLGTFTTAQLHALVLLFMELHQHGYDLGLLFFGLHCLVLGYLIIKSNYIPRIIGTAIMLAGLVYLAGSFILFLMPNYADAVAPAYVIPLIAELSLALWLIVKGVSSA